MIKFSPNSNLVLLLYWVLMYLHEYYLICFCNNTIFSKFAHVTGVGYDILVDMLKYIAPTHVVKINISAESKNLPAGAFWLDEDKEMVNLIEINSARQDSYNRS